MKIVLAIANTLACACVGFLSLAIFAWSTNTLTSPGIVRVVMIVALEAMLLVSVVASWKVVFDRSGLISMWWKGFSFLGLAIFTFGGFLQVLLITLVTSVFQ